MFLAYSHHKQVNIGPNYGKVQDTRPVRMEDLDGELVADSLQENPGNFQQIYSFLNGQISEKGKEFLISEFFKGTMSFSAAAGLDLGSIIAGAHGLALEEYPETMAGAYLGYSTFSALYG